MKLRGPIIVPRETTFQVSTIIGTLPATNRGDITLKITGKKPSTEEAIQGELIGRANICTCFDGQKISITFRRKSENGDLNKYFLQDNKALTFDNHQLFGDAKYDLSNSPYKPSSEEGDGLFTIDTLCKELSLLLFDKSKEGSIENQNSSDLKNDQIIKNHYSLLPSQGLLVISGSTNSAKSIVVQGLIYNYLLGQVRSRVGTSNRRPHLVTCEDPIEDEFYPLKTNPMYVGIDYTPRRLGPGKDVESLQDAFKDALRQTPAVFYVSEVRNEQDWKHVLNFAASGHFVVVTTHAGSLAETFDRMFSAMQVKSPAQRGQICQRILGVIHQKLIMPSNLEAGGVIPTVWRRTSVGISSMISEGLGSIIPHNPVSEKKIREKQISSLGRLYFAKRFLQQIAQAPSVSDKRRDAAVDVINQAAQFDILGE